MIDFTSISYAKILADMLERVPASYDKRDTSPIPTALGPAAYQIEGMYYVLDYMQRQAFIGTATDTDLDNLAALGGISRLQATPAVRLGVFNVPVFIGARFSTINGPNSIDFTVTAPTANSLEWWLTADTPGTIGNQYMGNILPITSITGLTSATLADIIVDGSDTETDDELRIRLTRALTDKPFAGNIAAYRDMLLSLEIGGSPVRLGGVQVYPTWDGGGTVKCSVVGSDYLPISSGLLNQIQAVVDPGVSGSGVGLAPIGAEVTISTPSAVTVNVSATVSHVSGVLISSIQQEAETVVEEYLSQIRLEWGVPEADSLTYISSVYLSRITAALLSISGVTNVTSVKINNSASDLVLTETATTQQVPVLGTITLTEA